jgi:hypothetical protein
VCGGTLYTHGRDYNIVESLTAAVIIWTNLEKLQN